MKHFSSSPSSSSFWPNREATYSMAETSIFDVKEEMIRRKQSFAYYRGKQTKESEDEQFEYVDQATKVNLVVDILYLLIVF